MSGSVLPDLFDQLLVEFPHLREHLDNDGLAEERGPKELVEVRLVRAEKKPDLFDYQEDIAAQAQVVLRERGRAILALPTGGGKTRTAAVAVLRSFQAGDVSKVIWLAPQQELCEQATRTLHAMWESSGLAPDLSIVRDLSTVSSQAKSIRISTPQSVHSLVSRGDDLPPADAIIFDEAHQLEARTFREGVEAMLAASGKAALIGLSATPGRTDTEGTESLVSRFHGNMLVSERLGRNPVRTLLKRGVYANLRFSAVVDGSPEDNEATRLARTARLCEWLISNERSRPLVFTASLDGARLLAATLRSTGIDARSIEGTTAGRSQMLEDFASGRVQVLVNNRLLATGYDCPAVTDIVLAGRVGTAITFEQIVGRAARGPKTGGSPSATIWEFDDHVAVHGEPRSYARYSEEFDYHG